MTNERNSWIIVSFRQKVREDLFAILKKAPVKGLRKNNIFSMWQRDLFTMPLVRV